jgi:hypothetical protein
MTSASGDEENESEISEVLINEPEMLEMDSSREELDKSIDDLVIV